ncbi:MAG: hypothetical protein AAF431_13400 [Pseudomonadota bacterium]
MKSYKIWLLKLILPVSYGHIATAVLLFAVLFPFFSLGTVSTSGVSTPALFFSMIIAYIIPVFSYITAKVKDALVELRPSLQLDDDDFAEYLRRLDSASLLQTLSTMFFGLVLGFAHLTLIRGSVGMVFTEFISSLPGLITVVGTLMVWTVMTIVTTGLIQQAALFARLGANQAQLSLLNKRKLLPFARVSIISSLSIIGALVLFPLMSIGDDVSLVESLPGAIATLIPLIVMFIIPIWPVHRRLTVMKENELNAIDEKISHEIQPSGKVELELEQLDRLAPLLNYRREIANVSTWPFDIGTLTRLSLYLILPPLTWVGAALIENLVDSML